MTAIERLIEAAVAGALENVGPSDISTDDYRRQVDADAAAVEALYQAAKEVEGMFPPRTRFGSDPRLIALAAARRQVEAK